MRKALFLLLVLALSGCGKERIGLVWERQESGTDYTISAVHFLDAQRGYAVGGDSWYFGLSLETANGGRTWQADSMANKQLFALDFDEEGTGVAGGIDGYVFRKREEDIDWQFFRYPNWDYYRSISHRKDVTLLVSGEAFKNGAIVRLNQFQPDTLSVWENELSAIWLVDEATAIAAGFGIVLRSEDGGRSWSPLPVKGDYFQDIHFPSERVGYIVGLAGTILKTEDGGATWDRQRNGGNIWVSNRPFRAVCFADEQRGYIAGDGGLLWKTDNGGADWMVVEDLPEIDFTDVCVVGNEGWLVGKKGAIIHFRD
jgi:photosystem II stability/assembly factor-like uncharacterized protein